MNKVKLVVWYLLEDGDCLADGATLHINDNECYKWISDNESDKYKHNDIYDAFIDDNIYEILQNKCTLVLSETSYRNMLDMQDIICK